MKWSELSLRERKQVYDSVRAKNPNATYFEIKEQFDSIPEYENGEEKVDAVVNLPEIEIKPDPIKMKLTTYYPLNSKYHIGHSELQDDRNRFVESFGPLKTNDYNLITNNCSDATRRDIESISNTKMNPFLFTTPGDVRDFVHNIYKDNPSYSRKEISNGDLDLNRKTIQEFEIPFDKYRTVRNDLWNRRINSIENSNYPNRVKSDIIKQYNKGILKTKPFVNNQLDSIPAYENGKDDIEASFSLPEVNIYPQNRFGDIARSQGIETARNWKAVREGTTKGINDFANSDYMNFAQMTLPLPGGLEGTEAAMNMIGDAVKPITKNIKSKIIAKAFNKNIDNININRAVQKANSDNVINIAEDALVPFKNKANNINYFDAISSKDAIGLPEFSNSTIEETRNWLKKFNKWNAHYGYDPIPLSSAANPKEADKLIKDRLLEHNTFVRGVLDVDTNPKLLNKVNNQLISLGIEPTQENRLRFFASTYAPQTGAGRAGFNQMNKNEGALYTSNSLENAKGYSTKSHSFESNKGGAYVVRRPIDLSGTNRDKWVQNAEFSFDASSWNRGNTHLFEDYELPYLLRYGKSARNEISKGKKVDYEKIYKDIYDKALKVDEREEKLFKNGLENFVELSKKGYKYLPENLGTSSDPVTSEVNKKLIDKLSNILSFDSAISEMKKYNFYVPRELNKIIKKSLNKEIDDTYRVSFNGNNIEIIEGDTFKNYDELKHFGTLSLDYLRKEYDKKINSELGKLFSRNHIKKLRSDVEKGFRKEAQKKVGKAKSVSQSEIMDFVESAGIHPKSKPSNITTSEELKKTSRNVGNPYQHFIFNGRIGTKALDIVRKLTDEELKDVMGTRQHFGTRAKGLSRKSRALLPYVSLEEVFRYLNNNNNSEDENLLLEQ